MRKQVKSPLKSSSSSPRAMNGEHGVAGCERVEVAVGVLDGRGFRGDSVTWNFELRKPERDCRACYWFAMGDVCTVGKFHFVVA